MDDASAQSDAEQFLDRAAERARDASTPPEVLAQIGIGYAVLALVDEVDSLRRAYLNTREEF
jgi:hypothetical protein